MMPELILIETDRDADGTALFNVDRIDGDERVAFLSIWCVDGAPVSIQVSDEHREGVTIWEAES